MPYIYRWGAWRRWLPIWVRRTAHARPVRLFIQRGRRGWSDEDLWSFDIYLAKVMADGFRALADRTHGWPSGQFDTFEDYQKFLRKTADVLAYWASPDGFAEREAFEAAQQAMREVAEYWGTFWD